VTHLCGFERFKIAIEPADGDEVNKRISMYRLLLYF